ncbi:hypothetical protein KY290_030981 [Solanum tuberosum]|uniref:Uncharacterized protein n=1 Tax=Solanum tuberosum TaxID=4113 RepID=A0ABQ7U945_SOLTU|nr:hypothetical protein KY290_030981 [Solanum tuberosum]
MTDKVEFNAAENIMIPIENPEGSRNMTDIQNEEKMSRMEQELEILREELRQVRDLAKLSATLSLLSRRLSTSQRLTCLIPTCQISQNKLNTLPLTVEFHQLLQPQLGPFPTFLIATLPYLQCNRYLGIMSLLPMSHMFHPYMLLELLPLKCQQWLMSRMMSINMQKWRKIPS